MDFSHEFFGHVINGSEKVFDASDSSINFQTGGYIIEEHVSVTSTLTGQSSLTGSITNEGAMALQGELTL